MEAGQDSPPLAAGSRIDAYQIAEVVEQGRYSYTYLGRDAAGTEVLIKELLPHEFALRDGDTVRSREAEDKTPLRFWLRSFLDKAVLLQKLNHPGLTRVLKQFEANGTGYYVTERIPGQTLAEILQRDGTLSEAQLRRLLAPLLSGLEQAHAVGLLHRDIRPENILVRGDDSAVLGGFGVLRAPIRFRSRTVFSAGAPPYAAPEEFFMAGPHGPWTDLYGLGASLWHAVTGAPPPDARSRGTGPALPPAAMAAKVRLSEPMAAAIDESLHLTAQQRPQTVTAWRAALQGESGAEGAAASAAMPEEAYASAPPQRSPLPLLAGVVLAIVAAAGGYFAMRSSTPQQPAASAAASTAVPAAPVPDAAAAAPAASAPAAAAPAGQGANLDQLAQDLMAREKKLAEAREQLQQAQRDQTQEKPAKPAAAPAQQPAAAAAPAPAPAAEQDPAERLKQLQAEVDKLRKEKGPEAAAPTSVASAAPAPRSGPGPDWSNWYRDATGAVRQSLRYPQKSLQGGEEGDVMVKLLLKRDGSILKTELVQRTPYSALNGEALAVFSRIGRFAPVPADYSPGNAQVELSMPINFKIAADQ
jgi:TonB family protein